MVHSGGPKGNWGAVCVRPTVGSIFQDLPNSGAVAQVACRQLGFRRGGTAARTAAFYGSAKPPIVARVYNCNGKEQRLEDCTAGTIITEECSQADLFGVWCGGEPTGCNAPQLACLAGPCQADMSCYTQEGDNSALVASGICLLSPHNHQGFTHGRSQHKVRFTDTPPTPLWPSWGHLQVTPL